MCGSAFKNKGVQTVLDAVMAFLPSPLDNGQAEGFNPDTEETEVRQPSTSEPMAALAFKIATDPFVGRLCFTRAYSGNLDAGSYVLNTRTGKKERISRIFQMHADKQIQVPSLGCGDIAALIGFKDIKTGDTLCDLKHPIVLESMDFPEPVVHIAIEPKTKLDSDKLTDSLIKLAEEDPTFITEYNEETGQTIISGMGELHLEIIVDRLKREFLVEANVGTPQVAYREKLKKEVTIDYKYSKQSGGKGQYAHISIKVAPGELNKGLVFKNKIVGGKIPKEYIPAVEKGIKEAMSSGPIAGYPIMDSEVELYDGSYHPVDSSEMAFKTCGSLAFKDAMQRSGAVLMEPVMKVEIHTPIAYVGAITGNLSSRRGRVEGLEIKNDFQIIRAIVPLSEMFGYTSRLRNLSQGRASSTMEFKEFSVVPEVEMKKIMKKFGYAY